MKRDPGVLFGLLALTGLLGLTIWSVAASGPTPSVGEQPPVAAQFVAAVGAALHGPIPAPTASPAPQDVDATQDVIAYWTPGAPPTTIALAARVRAETRCGNGWEQLVRVHDTAGIPWWVSQQDVLPDPARIGPDKLLPLDSHTACHLQRTP